MKQLTKKEKRLLKILGVAAASCIVIILLSMKLPQLRDLQEEIGLREERISNIQALRVDEQELDAHYQRLIQAIATEKDRYYAPQDRDLTRLGIKMLSLIRKNDLRYSRLNKVESRDGNYLEIALNGHIINIMRLLDDIYANPKYLNVDFLSVSNKGGKATATMRMNYGENAPVSP